MVRSMSCQEFAPLSKQGGFDMIDVRTSMSTEVHAVGALSVPLDRLNPELIMTSEVRFSGSTVCYLSLGRSFGSGMQCFREKRL